MARMSSPHRPVESRPDFPALEGGVLERWRERDVFKESVRRREGAPEYVFYEGPPTANAPPGSHHVLARVFKDFFPRYKTMLGFHVERKGGWDTHGLPVEIAVERELGITVKEEIENLGIAEFNRRCREKVFTNLEEWNALTERIGFWIDLDDAYRTLDPTYIESVWWALRQIWDKELLFERFKVVPYCPRCETSLSSHELGQPDAYREVDDPSVYVRFPVAAAHGPVQEGDNLLAWTTTPWTLASNAALAVDPDLIYVRARVGDEVVVLAEELVERVIPDGADILASFPGRDIEGAAYVPPFPFIGTDAFGPRGHTVLLGDFVSAEDGTGIVHTSISFGEEDFRLGEQYGLNVINPVHLDGTFDERIGPFAGRRVKDTDPDIIADLETRERVFRSERIRHSYPHCWRCGTPLIYYAKPSWYIATSQIRDRMLAANETIAWYPDHIKHGRFGNWLENNVDWALSRERYWGTPLPVWRCADEPAHLHCIGSLDELEERSGVRLEDPHRPFVDDVTFACGECGGEMARVPEVIDVWFDSGCMPFAQYHAPFENQEHFERRFPADFICEALDQTRGWFYSLLAVSTLLFDRASYEHVLCLGLLHDPEGRKMSKSLGNIVEPSDVLDVYGADAFRWYYFTAKQPWDGYRFSAATVGESLRQFLLQLWNTYAFYVLFANANRVAPEALEGVEPATELDRWIESRLHATTETVRERLDDYDTTSAGRQIAAFVDDLSNWYIRRSRRRFWDGDPAAFATLRRCLVTVSKLLAPFVPFVSDEIYENLVGDELSVHLTDYPEPGPRDEALEADMEVARETVRLGLAARTQARIKLRQPLREAAVVATGRERAAIERLADVVREELNVKELRFVSGADELGRYEIKPNYRTLGPRFGRAMPTVAAAVAALDPAEVAGAVRGGVEPAISVDGHDHVLGAEDLVLSLQPLEGYQVEREGSHAVALDLTLDEELRREGLAREVVHAIQAARKDAGLAVEDRIALALEGDEEVLAAVRTHQDYVAGEVLATQIAYAVEDGASTASVDGRELRIAVSRA
jgi:isoleucyl-tRNA synthetase